MSVSPRLKIVFACFISAAISSSVFIWMDRLMVAEFLGTVALLIPGIAFYLALDGVIGRATSLAWRITMAIVIAAGWYLAFETATQIESPIYIAGAAGGAIGGVAMFVALLPHLERRTMRNAVLLVLNGAVIGAICVPAGFLFGAADNLHYLFLTFLPWQIGMGLIVAANPGQNAPFFALN